MADLNEATQKLLSEVDAHLDYADDDGMQAAAELVREQLADGAPTVEAVENLLSEVSAHLDHADDEDMQAAADAATEAVAVMKGVRAL